MSTFIIVIGILVLINIVMLLASMIQQRTR